MTVHALVITAGLVALVSGSALAQEPRGDQPPVPRASTEAGQRGRTPEAPRPATPATAPAAAPAAERPRREGQPVNIKVDLTLTDQRGGRHQSSAR